MKMRTLLFALVAVPCLLFLALYLATATANEPAAEAPPPANAAKPGTVGRYTIVARGSQLILCDTVTGECWQEVLGSWSPLVKSLAQADAQMETKTGFRPILRLDPDSQQFFRGPDGALRSRIKERQDLIAPYSGGRQINGVPYEFRLLTN